MGSDKEEEMSGRKSEKFQEFSLWYWGEPLLREPKTQVELAAKLGVTEQTIVTWKKDLEDGLMGQSPSQDLKDREHLRNEALRPHPNAKVLEMYLKSVGIIKDEKTITHKIEFTGEDFAKLDREAEQRAADKGRAFHRGTGRVEISEVGLPLLPESVCLDTEQEHSADS